jgi:cytochrome c
LASKRQNRLTQISGDQSAREFAMSRISRRLLILALAALTSFARVDSMAAQELGTPDQAKAMLDRAIAALKSDEPGALSKFNDPSDQQFHDRDLYIFCFDVSDGKITADSSNGLRGIDIRALKLKDDPMGQRAYDIAQSAPQESVRTMDYSFPKPGTTEPAAKQFLETRVDNQGCGVAYYQ